MLIYLSLILYVYLLFIVYSADNVLYTVMDEK